MYARIIGCALLLGLLGFALTAHGADGGGTSSTLPSAGPVGPGPVGPGPWSAFWGALGTVLGGVIGRAGGIPIVWITRQEKS